MQGYDPVAARGFEMNELGARLGRTSAFDWPCVLAPGKIKRV